MSENSHSKKPTIIKFPNIGEPDIGYISVAQYENDVPFIIKRVFWTYYTPHHIVRGRHAHYKLQQILIAVSGIIEIETESINGEREAFLLDNPKFGLFLPPNFWHTMKFSHNGVLLSLASEHFSESDYIRDYDKFKNLPVT